MAKNIFKKKIKEETLETILFNCRDYLRGKAQMTDKRDLLLTLVFIKFLGDRFNQRREKIAEEVKARGIDDEAFIQIQLQNDPIVSNRTYYKVVFMTIIFLHPIFQYEIGPFNGRGIKS